MAIVWSWFTTIDRFRKMTFKREDRSELGLRRSRFQKVRFRVKIKAIFQIWIHLTLLFSARMEPVSCKSGSWNDSRASRAFQFSENSVIKNISCSFLISISQPNWNKSSPWLVSILSARHDAHDYHFFKCWAGNRHCWLLSDTTSAFLRTFHKITGRRLAARSESSKGRCLARPQFCVLFASQRDSKECLASIDQITITFIILKITRNYRQIRAQSGVCCTSWNSSKWYLTI